MVLRAGVDRVFAGVGCACRLSETSAVPRIAGPGLAVDVCAAGFGLRVSLVRSFTHSRAAPGEFY
jgi:hypothetical protein